MIIDAPDLVFRSLLKPGYAEDLFGQKDEIFGQNELMLPNPYEEGKNLWAPYLKDEVRSLENSGWKIVFIQASGISPFSASPPDITNLSAIWFDQTLNSRSWRFNRLSEQQKRGLSKACLNNMMVSHNSVFALNWLRWKAGEDGENKPSKVFDLLLFQDILFPDRSVLHAKAFQQKSSRGLDELSWIYNENQIEKDSPQNWIALDSEVKPDSTMEKATALYHLLTRRLSNDSDLTSGLERFIQGLPGLGKDYLRYPIHLSNLHFKGMPIDVEALQNYLKKADEASVALTEKLVCIEPMLQRFSNRLMDTSKGINDDLRKVLANSFQRRGVVIEESSKTLKIGESSLRKAGTSLIPEARELFTPLVTLNNLQKNASTAKSIQKFITSNGRIHSFFSPNTATGRLTSSSPNVQQIPGDHDFRRIVGSEKRIVSCDFSALDMRVGAALAIREQIQLFKWLDEGILADAFPENKALRSVLSKFDGAPGKGAEKYREFQSVLEDPAALKAKIIERTQAPKNRSSGKYINGWQEIFAGLFVWRLLDLFFIAQENGEQSYSALRNAFNAGVEIHTYTALRMNRTPIDSEIKGMSPEKVADLMKELKVKIGSSRDIGKIANLSLLYGMSSDSFRDHAASKWDLHLSKEESDEIINSWFEIYPEIELISLSTRMRGVALYDDSGRRLKFTSGDDRGKPITYYQTSTLSNRALTAFGLSAGINYPDQGTGADILVRTMSILEDRYPEVLDVIINQVHDELVIECNPEDELDFTRKLQSAMNEAGDELLSPFGIFMASNFTGGSFWAKN